MIANQHIHWFSLSFMATMETNSYALPPAPSGFDFLKVQVDQKNEETKKTLQSLKDCIVKKVYAQAALLKSQIAFLQKRQYQNNLIAKGYDLNSTGTSNNTITIAHTNTSYTFFHGNLSSLNFLKN
ncbi:preprotein translocase ATPase subunit [unidentified eubacterium SCB49]|nr:preprotein translocase ATPase subunit [unidentified eubacterium SCB49]